ncbi:hypothetical protein [Actinokineospora inagensis]|uniref:hypothetical protein n=1 Tax=Actinokineospora inagensis TaxID=103730 RepID=UPI0006885661|nr:hypothetical protein [Actinokineospora inagensis]
MRKTLVTLAIAIVIAVTGVFGFAGYAGADTVPVDGAVSTADTAAAQAVAATPDVSATVGKFLGAAGFASTGPAQVGGSSVPVYELTGDFVAGKSTKVGRLAYVAVPAACAGGAKASVWTVRDGAGHWSVANIAAGDLEFRHAAEVGAGAVLLQEPQTNSWYALTGNSVRSLATGRTVTVAQYQRDVAARYGDKLPGSAYDRQGVAGGFATPGTGGVDPSGTGATGVPGTAWPVFGILVVGIAAVATGAVLAARPAARRR